MLLVAEKPVVKNKIMKNYKSIYINTLTPNFEFRNNYGEIVKPKNCCISY